MLLRKRRSPRNISNDGRPPIGSIGRGHRGAGTGAADRARFGLKWLDKAAAGRNLRPMEPGKLDSDRIIAETLKMMAEGGIDKFSMRMLASRLSVRAPTLYWYFPDKASILRATIKTLFAQVVGSVSPCATWQDWMRAFGASLWRLNRDLPYTTILLQSAELNDAEVYTAANLTIERQLEQYPVNRTLYLRVHSDIQALVLGWAVFVHSGIGASIQSQFDVDDAVRDGIDMIVSHWQARAAVAD